MVSVMIFQLWFREWIDAIKATSYNVNQQLNIESGPDGQEICPLQNTNKQIKSWN